jgi:hypothetical protein
MIKEFLARVRCFLFGGRRLLVTLSVLFFIFGSTADILSSRSKTPGFEETNPFARNADHSFNAQRAITGRAILFADISIFSAVLFFGLSGINRDWAAMAASVSFLYMGVVFLVAASSNFLVRLGYFTP